MIEQQLRSLIEPLGNMVGDDPVAKGTIVLANAVLLVAVSFSTLARFLPAKKQADRIKINADVPSDQEVSIKTRKKQEGA